ncbi:MAG: phosphotransferase [Anaerolineae bacterium]|jgi:hypothetical protein
MDSAAQVKAIDRATLTLAVRRALARSTAEVLDWQTTPLPGGEGNPVSLGLYRISGLAMDQGRTRAWSLVLKMAQSPANVGAVDMGEGEDGTHWNYWKREMLLYQSDLLDHLPQGLAAPCCYGTEERPGDVIWLWLEDVQEVSDRPWPLDRYALAARHFGRFNGAYLAGRPLPCYAWLGVRLLDQWCRGLLAETPLFSDFARRPNMWDHPLVRRIYPPHDANPFLHLLMNRDRFLAALDGCPRTLCHQDAYPTNLTASRGEDGEEVTVALDWAMAGIGPVGEELAQLAIGAVDRLPTAPTRDVSGVLFAGYLDGLRDSGWHGDPLVVRFGYAASTALRIGPWLLWLLHRAFEERNALEAPALAAIEETIEEQARATAFVLDLSEEAHELLDALR